MTKEGSSVAIMDPPAGPLATPIRRFTAGPSDESFYKVNKVKSKALVIGIRWKRILFWAENKWNKITTYSTFLYLPILRITSNLDGGVGCDNMKGSTQPHSQNSSVRLGIQTSHYGPTVIWRYQDTCCLVVFWRGRPGNMLKKTTQKSFKKPFKLLGVPL